MILTGRLAERAVGTTRHVRCPCGRFLSPRAREKQMLDPRSFEQIARCFHRARYFSAVFQFTGSELFGPVAGLCCGLGFTGY